MGYLNLDYRAKADPEDSAASAHGCQLDRHARSRLSAVSQTGAYSRDLKFKAIITKEGTVANLTLVSGHPLLVPAAIDITFALPPK
jgi:hypothetical protein